MLIEVVRKFFHPFLHYSSLGENMSICPHCHYDYFEDNTSQPCCYGCGHPFTCGCSLYDSSYDEGSYDDDFDFSFDQDYYEDYEDELILNKESITELYHITNASSVLSILKNGILSKSKQNENQIQTTSVFPKSTSNDHQLHQLALNYDTFVHCYFNPKNQEVFQAYQKNQNLVILSLNQSLLNREDIYFTDANLSDPKTNIYQNQSDLDQMPWYDIFSNMVKSEEIDHLNQQDLKEYQLAEILVPNQIETDQIIEIFCFSKEIEIELKEHFNHVIHINTDRLFPEKS